MELNSSYLPPPCPLWTGYEQFGKMRSDPALCFKALCGEELPRLRIKKKGKGGKPVVVGKVGGAAGKGEESEVSDSAEEEESEGEIESGPSTPATPSGKRYMKLMSFVYRCLQYCWL